MDVVHRRALVADRAGVLSEAGLDRWVEDTLGHKPVDAALFRRALTHGSSGGANYERLEFLGDRVLGLIMAEWLAELFPREDEGALSKRLHALVSGATCAAVARELGASDHLRLGKQARDDGAADSDNVLGDVMESLIGALFRESGLAAARSFVRRAWGKRPVADVEAPQHPKSALLEWSAAHRRKPPAYQVVDRSGPDHAPRFTVQVALGDFAQATATGTSKQEAETAAAATLLKQLA